MRAIGLCLLMVSLSAVESKPAIRELIELTDGRTMTGTYDETYQVLTLDGGKMSIKVPADQIRKRSPAKPIEAPKKKSTDEELTPQEKAVAAAGVQEAKIEATGKALKAEADRIDKDALQLLAKAKACEEKATVVARSFQTRARKENEHYHIETILREAIITKKTNANNQGALDLMKDFKRLTKEAEDKQALAKTKRAEANQMLGIPNEAAAPSHRPPPQPQPRGPHGPGE